MAGRERTLRLGIVGCGEVTRYKHLPVLASIPEISVVALADSHADRARELAAKFGIPEHTSDAAKLISNPAIDSVGVLTDPGSHADLAISAIRAGKHVYVEKPLALLVADARSMLAAAAGANVVAMAGFHMRFHRLVREGRRLLQEGAIGPVQSVRVVWHSPRGDNGIPAWKTRRESGGGSLVEIAVHHFDLVRFLLGQEFDRILALSRDGARHDESAVIMARMQDGTLVSGEFSERCPHEIEIALNGMKGRLGINGERFDGLELRVLGQLSGAPAVRLGSVSRFLRTLPVGLTTMRRGGDYLMSYAGAWRHFSDCIANHTPPAATFHDGLKALEAVAAACHSAKEFQKGDPSSY